jgi:hypothetical protein
MTIFSGFNISEMTLFNLSHFPQFLSLESHLIGSGKSFKMTLKVYSSHLTWGAILGSFNHFLMIQSHERSIKPFLAD